MRREGGKPFGGRDRTGRGDLLAVREGTGDQFSAVPETTLWRYGTGQDLVGKRVGNRSGSRSGTWSGWDGTAGFLGGTARNGKTFGKRRE